MGRDGVRLSALATLCCDCDQCPLQAVKLTSHSRWSVRYGADWGRWRGGLCRGAVRPTATSKVWVCYVRFTSTPAGRKRQRASFDRSLMSHMGLDMAAGHDRVPPGRSPHLKGYLSAGTCTNVPLANGATSLPGNGLPRRTAFSRFRREKSRRRDIPRAPENWVWMLRGQSKHVLERRCRGKPTLGFDSATKKIPFG